MAMGSEKAQGIRAKDQEKDLYFL